MRPTRRCSGTLLAGAIALLIALPAHSQWKWVDENGRMTYSDQPPPRSVPASRILNSGAQAFVASAAKPAGPSDQTPGERSSQPASTASQPAASRGAAAQARERQQAEHAAALGRACEAMRTEARTLESGMRVARVNAKGEPEVLGDEDRASRIAELKRDLQANCPIS